MIAAFIFGLFFLFGMLMTLGVLTYIWPAILALSLWGIIREWRIDRERARQWRRGW